MSDIPKKLRANHGRIVVMEEKIAEQRARVARWLADGALSRARRGSAHLALMEQALAHLQSVKSNLAKLDLVVKLGNGGSLAAAAQPSPAIRSARFPCPHCGVMLSGHFDQGGIVITDYNANDWSARCRFRLYSSPGLCQLLHHAGRVDVH